VFFAGVPDVGWALHVQPKSEAGIKNTQAFHGAFISPYFTKKDYANRAGTPGGSGGL